MKLLRIISRDSEVRDELEIKYSAFVKLEGMEV